MKNYLQMLKNIKASTQGTAKSAKRPESQILDPYYSFYSNPERHFSKNHLQDLLSEVGAEIVQEDSSPVLRFNPYLAGPQIDPDRWQKALELEKLFFETVSIQKIGKKNENRE